MGHDDGETKGPDLRPGRHEVQTRLSGMDAAEPVYANVVHVNADRHAVQVIFSRFLPPPRDCDR